MKLIKPNRNTRHRLYKEAKEIYKSNTNCDCICKALKQAYTINYNINLHIYNTITVFPDLLKYKPRRIYYYYEYWWTIYNKDIRLQTFDKLINDTKP